MEFQNEMKPLLFWKKINKRKYTFQNNKAWGKKNTIKKTIENVD